MGAACSGCLTLAVFTGRTLNQGRSVFLGRAGIRERFIRTRDPFTTLTVPIKKIKQRIIQSDLFIFWLLIKLCLASFLLNLNQMLDNKILSLLNFIMISSIKCGFNFG
jgi:hypothetical protein